MKPVSEWPNRYLVKAGADGGSFTIPYQGKGMHVIASFGMGFDHVSVSLQNRCPTWPEMCYVKNLFWYDTETVIQYHPASADYINNHKYCLHMWKPQNVDIPKPPKMMVGV